ncbi:MAG: hypothetical protein WCI50_15165, partial [Actinomycetes bacterium]
MSTPSITTSTINRPPDLIAAAFVDPADLRRAPDATAIAVAEGERTWTYAELADAVTDVATRIAGSTAPGDPVALLAVNDAPGLIALLGI